MPKRCMRRKIQIVAFFFMHVAGTKWVENLNLDLREKGFNPLLFASMVPHAYF